MLLLFITALIQCTAAWIGHLSDAYFAASKACCYVKHKPYCDCLNICCLERFRRQTASEQTLIIKLMFNLKKSPDVISSLQTVVFILLCVGVSIPQDFIYSSFTSQFFSDSAFFSLFFPCWSNSFFVALRVKISKGSVISILIDYNCYHKDVQFNEGKFVFSVWKNLNVFCNTTFVLLKSPQCVNHPRAIFHTYKSK